MKVHASKWGKIRNRARLWVGRRNKYQPPKAATKRAPKYRLTAVMWHGQVKDLGEFTDYRTALAKASRYKDAGKVRDFCIVEVTR